MMIKLEFKKSACKKLTFKMFAFKKLTFLKLTFKNFAFMRLVFTKLVSTKLAFMRLAFEKLAFKKLVFKKLAMRSESIVIISTFLTITANFSRKCNILLQKKRNIANSIKCTLFYNILREKRETSACMHACIEIVRT